MPGSRSPSPGGSAASAATRPSGGSFLRPTARPRRGSAPAGSSSPRGHTVAPPPSLGGLFAGQATPELRAFLAGMCAVARRHLGSARAALAGADRAVLPAFLPLALVEAELKRMEKAADPLRDAGGLSPFRRQWLIWRAARRGRV